MTKLCIPIEYRPEGGLYTFIANLTSYLTQAGVPFTRDLDDDYDVLFTNSWVVPYEQVRRAKERKPQLRIVQRVDGAAQDYGRGIEADAAQSRVNLLADLTIFQSHYAKTATTRTFTVIHGDGPVIYNPVDLVQFTAARPVRARTGGRVRIANVSWSTNRAKGTWRIDGLAAAHPEVDFVLCGRYDGIADRSNIQQFGHLDRARLADVLRSCDLFLDLTEHEACPNVVLEALASGLPILHNNSGAVPELVGGCGVPLTVDMAEGLGSLLERREVLAVAARARAEAMFAPDVIFPQYLAAIESAVRHPIPGSADVARLVGAGYPVGPEPTVTPRSVAGAVARRARRAIGELVARVSTAAPGRSTRCRVGWITSDGFDGAKWRLDQLDSFTRIRPANVGGWINQQNAGIHVELYRRAERYDVVVFQKMMDARCQDEARRLQASGTKVVFDANVNYYEVWGDYFIPNTRPTEIQQRDAIAMTELADRIVADSSYLASVAAKFNPRVTWIPDVVNLDVYRGVKAHTEHRPVQLIWSGVGKKAAHLLEIVPALAKVRELELVLVSDTPPDCLAELQAVIPCRTLNFSDRAYAGALLAADVIVSPKRLVNAYEMGHTEYKIALGMAVGLPAVASPQQSYVEAIGHAGGGIIADTPDAWVAALSELAARPDRRREIGERARRTVVERYSTPVVAAQFVELFEALAGVHAL
jgi:glycosyltransferase involved in cell wall biosynthesis